MYCDNMMYIQFMRSYAYLTLICLLLIVSCQDTTQTTVTISDSSYELVEQGVDEKALNVEPLKSVPDWLGKIAAGKQPDQKIDVYAVGLFSASNQHTVFIQGLSQQSTKPDSEANNIVFLPEESYAKLPESYTKGLDHAGLLAKLAADVGAYTQTSAFQQSYLAKAKAIVIDANGKVIWKK